MRYFRFLIFAACALWMAPHVNAATTPDTPAVDYVVPLATQPFASNPAVLWYDNFDKDGAIYTYFDYDDAGGLFTSSSEQTLGGTGMALRAQYVIGNSNAGYLWANFGRNPLVPSTIRPTEDFSEVYWRVYMKQQRGYTGVPDKFSRAGIFFAADDWSRALTGHIWWAGTGYSLTLDPLSVITGATIDKSKQRWLGAEPRGGNPVLSPEENGKWICYEASMKLNTPGLSDGTFSLWIDGRLDAYRDNLDWRGTWTQYGINALSLETWVNGGAKVDGLRYFDDFVISTKRIGLARTGLNPVIVKTPFSSADATDTMIRWQAQVAQATDGEVIWASNSVEGSDQVAVDSAHGTFRGTLSKKTALAAGTMYTVRVRQKGTIGAWSEWSNWRAVIQTQDKAYGVWQ